jgi:hypothetical protein
MAADMLVSDKTSSYEWRRRVSEGLGSSWSMAQR